MAVAAVLILAERVGEAVQSPAKSALLADAASEVGIGRGMGVHKALDQVGAFAGPLPVAGLVAATAALLWPGSGGVGCARGADGAHAGGREEPGTSNRRCRFLRWPYPRYCGGERVNKGCSDGSGAAPALFMLIAASSALCTAGLVTFGLIGFHLVEADVVGTAGVPLLYAAAMAAVAPASGVV